MKLRTAAMTAADWVYHHRIINVENSLKWILHGITVQWLLMVNENITEELQSATKNSVLTLTE